MWIFFHSDAACFVLANKFSQDDLHEEDAEGVMRALAIKRFDRTIPLFVETILPENQSHFEYIGKLGLFYKFITDMGVS